MTGKPEAVMQTSKRFRVYFTKAKLSDKAGACAKERARERQERARESARERERVYIYVVEGSTYMLFKGLYISCLRVYIHVV
jgi:hypothetical protein